MARVEVDLHTDLPPERLMGALLDFSDRRPELWSNLSTKYYEVYEVGESSATVREGTGFPMNIWARERYDWSTPGNVSWSVLESNFCAPGSGIAMDMKPAPDGGSDLHVVWDRTPTSLKGRLIATMMTRNEGKALRQVLKSSFEKLQKRSNLPSHSP